MLSERSLNSFAEEEYSFRQETGIILESDNALKNRTKRHKKTDKQANRQTEKTGKQTKQKKQTNRQNRLNCCLY